MRPSAAWGELLPSRGRRARARSSGSAGCSGRPRPPRPSPPSSLPDPPHLPAARTEATLLTSAPALTQIPCLRPTEYSRISKRQKHVSRAYGGSRCANCVRQRCAIPPSPLGLHHPLYPPGTSPSSAPRPCLQDCARLPHRGAEDRQEGSQGAGRRPEVSRCVGRRKFEGRAAELCGHRLAGAGRTRRRTACSL